MTFCEICGRVMTGKFQLGETVLCKECLAEFGDHVDLGNPEEVEKIREAMNDAIHHLPDRKGRE